MLKHKQILQSNINIGVKKQQHQFLSQAVILLHWCVFYMNVAQKKPTRVIMSQQLILNISCLNWVASSATNVPASLDSTIGLIVDFSGQT